MKIINLTPHPVVLKGEEGIVTLPKSPAPARIAECIEPLGEASGIVIGRGTFGDPIDLPPPTPGVIYVVSTMMRLILPDRPDLVSPADLERDEEGRPVAARALIGGPWLQYWATEPSR